MSVVAALRSSAGLPLIGVWMLVAGAAATAAQPPLSRDVVASAAVETVTLIKAGDGLAVIRAAAGPLEKVKVGDRLGTTRARVTEIGAGRIVLEETFTAADGRPNRALIVIKEGERGGTRYLQRPDEPRIVGVKPAVVKTVPPRER